MDVLIGYIYFCCLYILIKNILNWVAVLSAVIIVVTSGTISKGKLYYFLGFNFSENSWKCTIQSTLKEYPKRRNFHRKKVLWILKILV